MTQSFRTQTCSCKSSQASLTTGISVTSKLHLVIHLLLPQLLLNILNKDPRTAPPARVADDHTLFRQLLIHQRTFPFILCILDISLKAFLILVYAECLFGNYKDCINCTYSSHHIHTKSLSNTLPRLTQ